MSWGRPKCASIRRPEPDRDRQRTACASVDRPLRVPPAASACGLLCDRSGDDLAVPHLVDVRIHQAGDQGLAEAEAGLHGGDLPVGGDGVGREQDAGRLREDHLLHDHRHLDLPVVEAVPQAVGHGPLGEERGPAPADVLEDRRPPHDVQVRVVLARERGRRQVLRRRARSDGVGSLLAEAGERAGDRGRQIVGDGDPFERPADLRAERTDRLTVVRLQAGQPIERIIDRRRVRHDPPERVRRHAEAGRHADALDSAKAPQGARPCRQRPRPVSGRCPGTPTRSSPSAQRPFASRSPRIATRDYAARGGLAASPRCGRARFSGRRGPRAVCARRPLVDRRIQTRRRGSRRGDSGTRSPADRAVRRWRPPIAR